MWHSMWHAMQRGSEARRKYYRLLCANLKCCLCDVLVARGYAQNKIQENIQAEIMQVILEEARESYDLSIIQELPSNSISDLESNCGRLLEYIRQWIQRRNSKSNSNQSNAMSWHWLCGSVLRVLLFLNADIYRSSFVHRAWIEYVYTFST